MDIRKLLNKEQVIFELKSKDKESVIRELVDVLDKNGKLNDKEAYLKAVLKREEEFSTGIGMGIAIPHGKSAGVKEASLVFARSSSGIDYNSMDGKPSYIFFLIAVPETSNNEHLKILSSLSRKLMHADIREKLMSAQSFDEIVQILNN